MFSFILTFAFFQDLSSGKVKEIGRLEDGLYLLNQNFDQTAHDTKLTTNNTQSSYNKIDINLWHKRFGHVSTVMLNKILPTKIETITRVLNKCFVCPRAKQIRFPFPESTIKSSSSFDMVDMDIEGPYKTPTVDGNKYFLTIVDDYTRMSWMFLLKLKFDIV